MMGSRGEIYYYRNVAILISILYLSTYGAKSGGEAPNNSGSELDDFQSSSSLLR